MKKTSFLLVLFLVSSFFAKAQFMYSFSDAQKLALATNKLLLLDFTASWCGPCKAMDANTWSQEEVKKLMNNFVSVKIDIDVERSISNKYSVRSIPNIFIVEPNGEVIFQSVGYKDKNKMMRILKKYNNLSTKFLQKELFAYFKKHSGDNALQLTEKYFDYSVFVDKKLRGSFLKIADSYLKQTKKLFKKEGNKHKKEQRIQLLYIYKNLIKGKYDKVLKSLDKDFKKDKIETDNKPLYDFLHFCSYNKLKDKENAKKWYVELAKFKDSKLWLLKSRKI